MTEGKSNDVDAIGVRSCVHVAIIFGHWVSLQFGMNETFSQRFHSLMIPCYRENMHEDVWTNQRRASGQRAADFRLMLLDTLNMASLNLQAAGESSSLKQWWVRTRKKNCQQIGRNTSESTFTSWLSLANSTKTCFLCCCCQSFRKSPKIFI